MLKKWMIGSTLLLCTYAHADWRTAINAYSANDFKTAQAEFSRLLPLGNAEAVTNLGAMAYQGQGMPVDVVQAMGYFKLAAALGSAQAAQYLTQLQADATPEQQQAANQRFEQLQQQVIIQTTATKPTQAANSARLTPVKLTEPEYPRKAMKSGHVGYVNMRYLVNEQGKVKSIAVVDSYPAGIFDKAATDAVKRWRYPAQPRKNILTLQWSFNRDDGLKIVNILKQAQDNQLFKYALNGSPEHQFALATMLEFVQHTSKPKFEIDDSLPMTTDIDIAMFNPLPDVSASFQGFVGDVIVKVAADGTIQQQLSGEIAAESQIKDLIGLKLSGEIRHETYQIWALVPKKELQIFAVPKVSPMLSAKYWLDRAARNGHRQAQRVSAFGNQQWMNYLLSDKDPEIMAWEGSRLVIEGQADSGYALLEQAQQAGYPLAEELRNQLAQ